MLFRSHHLLVKEGGAHVHPEPVCMRLDARVGAPGRLAPQVGTDLADVVTSGDALNRLVYRGYQLTAPALGFVVIQKWGREA